MSLYNRVRKLEAAAADFFESYDRLTCKENLKSVIEYFENETSEILLKNEEELQRKIKTKNRVEALNARALYILKNMKVAA